MYQETVVNSRPDRDIRKKIVTPGDYTIVPYEDARCRIKITDITCKNASGDCEIEPDSVIFNKNFDGNVLIGDLDFFIDKDVELVLQQMCCGETSEVCIVYRDGEGVLVREIKCRIELREVMEEQLISDWGWERLFETSLHHKECGVHLVKDKKFTEAFRRFNKALKMLIAIQPIDPAVINEEKVKEMSELKVKLYNNLAHLQLQYEEYDAAKQLCERALSIDQDNPKALYRRCVAYTGMKLYEEAWTDIQRVLQIEPTDKAALKKASELKPVLESMNKNYTNVIKKMFS